MESNSAEVCCSASFPITHPLADSNWLDTLDPDNQQLEGKGNLKIQQDSVPNTLGLNSVHIFSRGYVEIKSDVA